MSGRLIARFRSALFPELELGDAAINAQARRLNAFLLILVVGAVAALVAHAVRGSLVNVGFSLGSTSLMLGLRWWLVHRAEPRRVRIATLIMLGVALPILVVRALLNGQSHSAIAWVIAAVPVIAAHLVGVRWAIRFAVACIACLAFLYTCDAYPQSSQVPQTALTLFVGQVGMVLLLTAMAVAQRRVVDRQIAEVEAKHRTIQQQADELRQQAVELAQARDAALDADRLKGQFLANISHELRTPLHAVIGMTQVLLTTPLTPEQRDFASTVRTSGESLLALVNDLLDLFKLEARKVTLERLPVSVRPWAEQTLAIVAPQARAKGLQLSLAIAEDVPDRVLADPHRLRQILLNLVGNAVKFTERGEIEVRLSAERPAPDAAAEGPVTLHFWVRDTGIGIPADRLDLLFHVFSQADPSISRRYGGTGLGLSISKHLCELMGGTLSVESTPGQGSIFRFTLQSAIATGEPAADAQRSTAPVQPSALPAVPLRLLLADDNAINQKVGCQILKRLGHEADVASHGLEVLAALQRKAYDVVIMDVHMPELDGLSTTRRIRTEVPPERQPYVIALTASAMQDDRAECTAAGMDDFVSKPVEMESLAEALGRAQARRREAPVALLDFEALAQLQEICDPGGLESFVEEHLKEGQHRLDALRKALAAEDAATVESIAHGWKGTSSLMGVKRISSLCFELEALAHRGELARAAPLLATIEETLQSSRVALRAFVRTLPAVPGPPQARG